MEQVLESRNLVRCHVYYSGSEDVYVVNYQVVGGDGFGNNVYQRTSTLICAGKTAELMVERKSK